MVIKIVQKQWLKTTERQLKNGMALKNKTIPSYNNSGISKNQIKIAKKKTKTAQRKRRHYRN